MIRRILGLIQFGLTLLLTTSAVAAGHPLELPAPLQAALESLRNGHYQQTLESSRSLQESYTGHPLPSLMAAEANWGLIFCQTGHINSSEIWNAATVQASPFDGAFFQAVEEAIAAAEGMQEEPDSEALGAFYDGLAHGVRARLYTLRGEVVNSGREGKQMRESLLQASALDNDFRTDADAGLGAYNYYADVLSPLIKFFRFFLFIPGGDREQGLAQLQSASQDAVLLGPEARYELAKIYGLREHRPADALTMFRGLVDHFPDNAIFALSAAIQAERIGDQDLAADYARKAVQASAQMDPVCRVRLEAASQEALHRLLGSETP